MQVDEVLTLQADELGALRAPVMVVALTGWFDAAEVATTTARSLAPDTGAITVGEIDPDPFYDFTQERPTVRIDDGALRTIEWPRNAIEVHRTHDARDLAVVVGVEPHLHWATYAACIVTAARRLGCEAVVTLGSAAEAVPHTRTPVVTGSTTDRALARSLGLGAPSYQGITGVAGVLQAVLDEAGLPAVSLRVGVPHYLMNAEHPLAVSALRAHLGHVLGVGPGDDLTVEARRWRSLHDEVVEGDPQLRAYVAMLEHEHDRRAEASIPSADDLGAQFEEFLRERRDEAGDDESGD